MAAKGDVMMIHHLFQKNKKVQNQRVIRQTTRKLYKPQNRKKVKNSDTQIVLT